MSGTEIVRAVVRSFNSRQWREAALHVRRGGHAVVWEKPARAHLLLPCPDEDDPMDLALFSILDLGKQKYEVANEGPTKGLARTLVPRDCHGIIRQRIARDKVHRGATRRIKLDCLECGACCYSNRVVLSKLDVERFQKGGRGGFAKSPYTKKSDGQVVLRLAPTDKACLHLGRDNKCGIYDIRPEMCRDFPMASECCLSTRAEELDIYDGARPD